PCDSVVVATAAPEAAVISVRVPSHQPNARPARGVAAGKRYARALIGYSALVLVLRGMRDLDQGAGAATVEAEYQARIRRDQSHGAGEKGRIRRAPHDGA